MHIKIKGFGDTVYNVTATSIISTYLKIAFWTSPFAFWKLYEIIETWK